MPGAGAGAGRGAGGAQGGRGLAERRRPRDRRRRGGRAEAERRPGRHVDGMHRHHAGVAAALPAARLGRAGRPGSGGDAPAGGVGGQRADARVQPSGVSAVWPQHAGQRFDGAGRGRVRDAAG